MAGLAKADAKRQDLQQRIHEFRQVFDMFDKDKDGSLSLEEVKVLLERLGHTISHSELHSVFEELDSNSNGKLEFSEFLNLVLDPAHHQDALTEAFRLFDRDGDGLITGDEVRHALETVMNGQMSDRRFSKLLQIVDQNGDGKIDFEEFSRVMTKG